VAHSHTHKCVCVGAPRGAYRQSAYAPSPCSLCVTAALSARVALTSGRPHRSSAAWAAGAGGRATKGPVARCRAAHCSLRPKGIRPHSIFLGSPPCVRRLQVAKRACVLGAGVHVGQARDFFSVEVAPYRCGQPLAYAVPPVRRWLFELPSVLLRCLGWRRGLLRLLVRPTCHQR
jgi:hypothetical protein